MPWILYWLSFLSVSTLILILPFFQVHTNTNNKMFLAKEFAEFWKKKVTVTSYNISLNLDFRTSRSSLLTLNLFLRTIPRTMPRFLERKFCRKSLRSQTTKNQASMVCRWTEAAGLSNQMFLKNSHLAIWRSPTTGNTSLSCPLRTLARAHPLQPLTALPLSAPEVASQTATLPRVIALPLPPTSWRPTRSLLHLSSRSSPRFWLRKRDRVNSCLPNLFQLLLNLQLLARPRAWSQTTELLRLRSRNGSSRLWSRWLRLWTSLRTTPRRQKNQKSEEKRIKLFG